jgi:glycosyltransferase involved in cell wall biosynthesis
VAPAETPAAWVAALRRLATEDALCETLRTNGRRWVEENYDAHKNAARLHALMRHAMAEPPAP